MDTFLYTYKLFIVKSGGLISELIKSFVCPRAYCYHLWYMYMLTLLYALTPLIICIKKGGKSYLDYILAIWIIFNVIYPFLNFLYPRFCLKDWENIKVLGGYLGYYIMGYRLHRFKKVPNWLLIIMFCAGWMGTVILNIGYQSYVGAYNDYFMSFFSPGIVLMALSIFLLVKNLLEGRKNIAIISRLSRLSLGIYFVHYMVRDFVKIFLERGYINEWAYLAISPLMIIIISTVIIKLLSQNKILGFIFAGIPVNRTSEICR